MVPRWFEGNRGMYDYSEIDETIDGIGLDAEAMSYAEAIGIINELMPSESYGVRAAAIDALVRGVR